MTMAAVRGQQIEIRMVGTCTNNVAVRILLAAEIKGTFQDGIGPFQRTVVGNPVSCRGTDAPYTAALSLHRDAIMDPGKVALGN